MLMAKSISSYPINSSTSPDTTSSERSESRIEDKGRARSLRSGLLGRTIHLVLKMKGEVPAPEII